MMRRTFPAPAPQSPRAAKIKIPVTFTNNQAAGTNFAEQLQCSPRNASPRPALHMQGNKPAPEVLKASQEVLRHLSCGESPRRQKSVQSLCSPPGSLLLPIASRPVTGCCWDPPSEDTPSFAQAFDQHKFQVQRFISDQLAGFEQRLNTLEERLNLNVRTTECTACTMNDLCGRLSKMSEAIYDACHMLRELDNQTQKGLCKLAEHLVVEQPKMSVNCTKPLPIPSITSTNLSPTPAKCKVANVTFDKPAPYIVDRANKQPRNGKEHCHSTAAITRSSPQGQPEPSTQDLKAVVGKTAGAAGTPVKQEKAVRFDHAYLKEDDENLDKQPNKPNFHSCVIEGGNIQDRMDVLFEEVRDFHNYFCQFVNDRRDPPPDIPGKCVEVAASEGPKVQLRNKKNETT